MENPGMTFERSIEAVMACEIVLRDYYYIVIIMLDYFFDGMLLQIVVRS